MPHRILVIAPAWVGDSVMAQPLYRRLKGYRPDTHITVMAPDWTLPLLDRMAEVDATLRNPFGHGALRLGSRYQLGRRLRGQYDQAIVLPNSFKSALIPWFARIPQRTGFVGESRYGLLNDARTLDPKALPQMVERFAILAETAGRPLPRPVPAPRMTVDPQTRDQAVQALGLDVDRPVVAFCPGAEYGPAKRWPARHFAELARRLVSQGYAVWLFGSAKDQPETAAIAIEAGVPLVDLAGRTSLAQAIDLLSLAHLVVTNDSGLMHVAAALERPLVALYGSSSPEFTPPLNERAEIVTLDLDCSPCFERKCPLKHFDCMEKLGAELVESAIARVLTKPPGTPGSPYIRVQPV
ncbi:lipopolysaccharide heptosyltransferase II [Chitinimonas koreensis]|uniref:lipopolysaccharide heptosyltransferase II n=1 Tax=Chitinimonas koreensis TaxID=356302 RepID=UPI0003F81579|nr:lipopolysaccharide heptosyltransferase II [Chitinimonas koreensis]QNM98155.1 lipopolysaccharide heptosyltransferase II [Chitinimonas koreensis]